MQDEEFKKLVKKEGFQVFLMTSFVQMRPVSFLLHTWFVTVRDGKINRWEVWKAKNAGKTNWGYVHQNLFGPWEGRPKSERKDSKLFKSRLLGVVEGGRGSVAEQMVKFIGAKSRQYRNAHKYAYVGPNCNTFTQWVIKKFPEAKFSLPITAWGKWHKI